MTTSVLINETPQDLADLLGVESRGIPGVVTSVWSGFAQNISTTRTVYRLRSETRPDRVAAAFRHRPGEIFRLSLWSTAPTWFWTASGEACLVLEEVLGEDRA